MGYFNICCYDVQECGHSEDGKEMSLEVIFIECLLCASLYGFYLSLKDIIISSFICEETKVREVNGLTSLVNSLREVGD